MKDKKEKCAKCGGEGVIQIFLMGRIGAFPCNICKGLGVVIVIGDKEK